jgi:hypothetical protein
VHGAGAEDVGVGEAQRRALQGRPSVRLQPRREAGAVGEAGALPRRLPPQERANTAKSLRARAKSLRPEDAGAGADVGAGAGAVGARAPETREGRMLHRTMTWAVCPPQKAEPERARETALLARTMPRAMRLPPRHAPSHQRLRYWPIGRLMMIMTMNERV